MAKEQKAKQRTTEQKNPATKRRENPTPTATSQNKTKYMAASFTKYLPWINAFLFAAFAFYMLAVRNSDYLYAAQEHSLFLFDRSFYDMVMVKPGGTGRPMLAISARLAPLPPSSARMLLCPSALPLPKK